MRKYAGELRVGDVWTERPQNRVAQSYRVIGIAPGLTSATMRVTAESVTTGQRRTVGFFLFNRVEVREEAEPGRSWTNGTELAPSTAPHRSSQRRASRGT